MKKSDIRSLIPYINQLFLQIHPFPIYNGRKVNV